MITEGKRARRSALGCAVTVLALLGVATPSFAADKVLGLTGANEVVVFSSAKPGAAANPIAISGLAAGDTLVGIDVRPATGQLYGIAKVGATTTGQLYRIALSGGTATATAVGGASAGVITGANQGFDFNPFPDRVRVVNDEPDDSFRLNPNTGGAPTPDTALTFAAGDVNAAVDPAVSAIAYTNPVGGARATRLFGIDAGVDALTQFGPGNADPNNGQMTTRGPLGVNVDAVSGFDIATDGTALAALRKTGETRPRLYVIDTGGPAAGSARELGRIGNVTTGPTLTDIAIAPTVRTFAALTNGTPQQLFTFAANLPGLTSTPVSVTGVPAGVTLEGIDTRPGNGRLYSVGTDSRIYTLDADTGAATPVIAGAFTPALTGGAFGFDFNPQADRLRITSDTNKNKRLNPDTGLSAVGAGFDQDDTDLAYDPGDPNSAVNPEVTAVAYTNSVPGASNTTLYGIDTGIDRLVRQGSVDAAPVSPNAGTLFSSNAADLAELNNVALGVDATATAAYDIVPENNQGFAALNPTTTTDSNLYSVNPGGGAPGQAILVGKIGAPAGTLVKGLAFLGEDTITFGASSVKVDEGDGSVVLTVQRSGGSDTGTSVNVTITDGTAGAADHGAVTPATVTFAPGETVKTVSIPITDDGARESAESFTATLSGATGGAAVGKPGTATVQIRDNEPVPPQVRTVVYFLPINAATPPLFAVLSTGDEVTRGTLSRKGLRAAISCSAKCSYSGTLKLDARTRRRLGLKSTLVTVRGSFATGGRRAFRLKPSRAARRKLARTTGGKLALRVVVTDAAGRKRTLSQSIAIRR